MKKDYRFPFRFKASDDPFFLFLSDKNSKKIDKSFLIYVDLLLAEAYLEPSRTLTMVLSCEK